MLDLILSHAKAGLLGSRQIEHHKYNGVMLDHNPLLGRYCLPLVETPPRPFPT